MNVAVQTTWSSAHCYWARQLPRPSVLYAIPLEIPERGGQTSRLSPPRPTPQGCPKEPAQGFTPPGTLLWRLLLNTVVVVQSSLEREHGPLTWPWAQASAATGIFIFVASALHSHPQTRWQFSGSHAVQSPWENQSTP